MGQPNRWIALVVKLLRLTQTGEIKWQIEDGPKGLLLPLERVDVAYTTQYKDQGFRIYEYRFLTDDVFTRRQGWASRVKLELMDWEGRPIFPVPEVEGLGDLLGAVRYQAAEVDKVLEKILAE